MKLFVATKLLTPSRRIEPLAELRALAEPQPQFSSRPVLEFEPNRADFRAGEYGDNTAEYVEEAGAGVGAGTGVSTGVSAGVSAGVGAGANTSAAPTRTRGPSPTRTRPTPSTTLAPPLSESLRSGALRPYLIRRNCKLLVLALFHLCNRIRYQ
ncbi:unnamed protein product [Parnassius mnemosyne]|uniref:Uncharacterized protein n=1 Tax=Parnassius mnemosyne TaxID=213953 RepID=A0AAV1M8E3_9NEOP